MIKSSNKSQFTIRDFDFPFHGELLSTTNKWVLLADVLPWDRFDELYIKNLSKKKGARCLTSRMTIGALIIKHMEGLDDRGTIEAIQQNPYMQYFVGLKGWTIHPIFDPSLFVMIRKRISLEVVTEMCQMFIAQTSSQMAAIEAQKKADKASRKSKKAGKKSQDKDKNEDGSNPSSQTDSQGNLEIEGQTQAVITHKGALRVDATVAPADIRYPVDVNILNDCLKKSCTLIDVLYTYSDLESKPRQDKKKIHQTFVTYIKMGKNKKKKEIRKTIQTQLGLLKRNLQSIDLIITSLNAKWVFLEDILKPKSIELLETIRKVYQQQKQMYDAQNHSVKDRIVSIHQPHVRPMIRGKARSSTEFGAKINVCHSEYGYQWIDRLDWDCFYEGHDLIPILEKYKERYGYWPEVVQIDRAYLGRENRNFMKENKIRHTGKALGRPSIKSLNKIEIAQLKKDNGERNQIEGLFGQGKRKYLLNVVRTRLQETSESWIAMSFFVMNLVRYAASIFLSFISLFLISVIALDTQKKVNNIPSEIKKWAWIIITRFSKNGSEALSWS